MSKETSMVMIASSSSFNHVKEEYIKEKTRFMYKVIILTGKHTTKKIRFIFSKQYFSRSNSRL